jgi:hypothetical protein
LIGFSSTVIHDTAFAVRLQFEPIRKQPSQHAELFRQLVLECRVLVVRDVPATDKKCLAIVSASGSDLRDGIPLTPFCEAEFPDFSTIVSLPVITWLEKT